MTSLTSPSLLVSVPFAPFCHSLTLALTESLLFASQSHDVTPKYQHWRVALSAAVKARLGDGYVLVKDSKLVGVSSYDLLRSVPAH